MGAFFVTATGTDVGKTFVTAGLVRYLRQTGQPVSAFKPVMSGFDVALAAQSDAGVLLSAMDRPISAEAVGGLSPWRFRAPLSPDMAAAREGCTIDFEALVSWCRERIRSVGTIFVEGVGGLMVPLDASHTVLDWIDRLQIPLILVAGSYLGAISHTLTAARVCERAGLKIAALVINESEASPVPVDATAASVGRFFRGAPVLTVPRSKSPTLAVPGFQAILNSLQLATQKN